MDNADMNEVFKRLGERERPLFDEAHRELPFPMEEEPLFTQKEQQ